MKRKSQDNHNRREYLYGLQGTYLDAYDAIVRPDQVFAVHIYTLRRWVSILGAKGFWLLMTLQQRCYRNPRGNSWCIVSRGTLAAESCLSEATVHRYLHGTNGLCYWVQAEERRKYVTQAGRVTQAPNLYRVVMDAPLAPIDQRGLAQFFSEHQVGPGTSWTAVKPLLEQLAALRLTNLLDLLDEYAGRFSRSAMGWDGETFLPKVADVLLVALGMQMPKEGDGRYKFLNLCSRVQQALVGPVWLGTGYFRTRWLPILGPALSSLIVMLRSYCFWNENTLRDRVSMHFTDLAVVLGCSERSIRRMVNAPESLPFFTVHDRGRGQCPEFRVTLREPIAPQDEEMHRALLDGIEPESGQLALPEPVSETGNGQIECLGDGGNGQFERLGTDKSNVSETRNGQIERLGDGENGHFEHLGMDKLNVSETRNGQIERLGDRENGHFEHLLSTIISTSPEKTLKKHNHVTGPAATALLLRDFGIGPPNDGRILSKNPDASDVWAWMLYTLTQTGLSEPAIARGYVVNRLLAGEEPPERFRRWARLTSEQWQSLWRASYYGALYRATLPPDLVRILNSWTEDFGGVFPAGPFGDGLVEETQLRSTLADLGKPPGGGSFDVVVRGSTIWFIPAVSKVARWLRDQVDWIRETWMRQGILHEVAIAPVADASRRTEGTDVWSSALAQLRLQMTQSTFDTCLSGSKLLSHEDGTLVVGVKSEYARAWLESQLLSLIKRTVARLLEKPDVTVRFEALIE